jgi:hypothetical protein
MSLPGNGRAFLFLYVWTMLKNILLILFALIIFVMGLTIYKHNHYEKEQKTFMKKKLAGLKLGMTGEDILKILGKPDTIFYYKPALEDGTIKSLSYNAGLAGYHDLLICLDSMDKVVVIDSPYPYSD